MRANVYMHKNWGCRKTQHDIGLTTSCLDAARYPDGSVRKASGVCETTAAADVDEDEEFEGIFSTLGSLFGSM